MKYPPTGFELATSTLTLNPKPWHKWHTWGPHQKCRTRLCSGHIKQWHRNQPLWRERMSSINSIFTIHGKSTRTAWMNISIRCTQRVVCVQLQESKGIQTSSSHWLGATPNPSYFSFWCRPKKVSDFTPKSESKQAQTLAHWTCWWSRCCTIHHTCWGGADWPGLEIVPVGRTLSAASAGMREPCRPSGTTRTWGFPTCTYIFTETYVSVTVYMFGTFKVMLECADTFTGASWHYPVGYMNY